MSRRRGYTLVELVLVMLLLTLVASAVFTLAGAGSQTYLRLADKRGSDASARLAELAAIEAELATAPDPEFRFHSGTPA